MLWKQAHSEGGEESKEGVKEDIDKRMGRRVSHENMRRQAEMGQMVHTKLYG